MTPSTPQQSLSLANSPTPPPVFAQDPTGRKPKRQSTTPTVLGADSVPAAPPPSIWGGKTLMGQ